jgi:adenylate kinase
MIYYAPVMNIVILLGAPGSGKGTIAGRLASENANLKHVSSGDLLRGAVAKGTPAGVEAKGYMDKGALVPDALIAQMIKDVLAETTGDVTMLLDGFPRNVAQAEILEKTGAPIRSAVLVDVPDAIIQDRISGRRTCPKCKAGYHVKALPPKVEGICDKCGEKLVIRKDDNPATVKDRLVVYHRETEPLIAFYEKKALLRKIDGTQAPEVTAKAFLAAM